jgi:hypothetical protein
VINTGVASVNDDSAAYQFLPSHDDDSDDEKSAEEAFDHFVLKVLGTTEDGPIYLSLVNYFGYKDSLALSTLRDEDTKQLEYLDEHNKRQPLQKGHLMLLRQGLKYLCFLARYSGLQVTNPADFCLLSRSVLQQVSRRILQFPHGP